MEVERISEGALLVRGIPESPITAAHKFRLSFSDLVDVVPSFDTLGLYFQDEPPTLDALVQALTGTSCPGSYREHAIPVCYEMGLDLESSAAQLGLSVRELIKIHSSTTYRCMAVGFSPGFAYLGDTDPRISLPRLSSPRPRVAAGSVGITGIQTAVYPSSTPGGWNLIGVSPFSFVDEMDDYFPIQAGDKIKFYPIANSDFERLKGTRF